MVAAGFQAYHEVRDGGGGKRSATPIVSFRQKKIALIITANIGNISDYREFKNFFAQLFCGLKFLNGFKKPI